MSKTDSKDKFLSFHANGLNISYRKNENGGGMHFGQDYINVIRDRYGPLPKVYEFCSGPAFIGFSMIGANLIKEKLVLSDIHTPVKDSINRTLLNNDLGDLTCTFYNTNKVSSIEEDNIDLVISNPPHFASSPQWLKNLDKRIYLDEGWKIHKEFYENIKDKISNKGIILIQENSLGSNISDFTNMINDSGLFISDTFQKKHNKGNDQIYYIEVKRKI